MTTDKRIIWMFREPRSGSTTAMQVILKKLNRRYNFITFDNNDYINIPEFQQQENDHEVILDTHFFPALLSMKNYDNPFLIRISRKDTVEQCLSFIACQLMNWEFFNLKVTGKDDNRHVFEEFTKNKIEIKKDMVDFFARHRMRQNSYWEKIAPNHDHQVIYYEDMNEAVDIPKLGLYNLELLTETIKLPDYKKELFTNYDSVKEWLSVYKL